MTTNAAPLTKVAINRVGGRPGSRPNRDTQFKEKPELSTTKLGKISGLRTFRRPNRPDCMNITRFLLVPLAFLCFSASGQITDNFSDGDFTQNPAWQGDVANFVVNTAGELQLMAPAAGASTLVVAGNIPDTAIWNLHFRLAFAPSTSNLLRIYLLADQADLTTANGYFLEIGENGSLDALRFFRQDGGTETLLATGQAGLVGTDPVDIQLHIIRAKTGVWTIEAAAGQTALQLQNIVLDATYGGGPNRFFGFNALYSATRTDKFFFDNISILPDVPDTQPPTITLVEAESPGSVKVVFSEPIDPTSANNATNYNISNGVGQPMSATLAADQQTVFLSPGVALTTGNYTLQVAGVHDTTGNVMTTQTVAFQFVQIATAAEFDILINEIMADPTPAVGLPEVEWVEIFNRSNKTLDLSGLRFDDGGTPQPLPAYLLAPQAYVVLATTANATVLKTLIPNVIGITGFPSLNNDGDVLMVSTAAGTVIDRVAYSIDWHTESAKKDGGWTLERINPNIPCLGKENWQSAPALPGGTPGQTNASLQTTTDQTAPQLLAAFPESATSIRLTFSEGLDEMTAENPGGYQLTPARTVTAATLTPGDRATVTLTLDEPLQTGVVYTLQVTATVEDCNGNMVAANSSAVLGLPEQPEFRDIVINEILFNPASGGSRYVEFYNRSQKIFNWSEFFLSNFTDGVDLELITTNRLFLPGEYAVFTPSPGDITSRFTNVRPEVLYKNNLPSLDDKEDNLILFWRNINTSVVTVDALGYKESWHNPLLTTSEKEGVALERISPDQPTNSASNWTSAARPATGGAAGTPTQPNSQRLVNVDPGSNLITLAVDRLSPDNDGFEDFLDIRYTLPDAGFVATTTIFDSDGVPVKRLVRQQLIGSQGALRWDGDTDDGNRARPGIYILYVELFSPSGETKHAKKPFALVARF